MPQVNVNFGNRSYVINIGPGILSEVGKTIASIKEPSVVAVISNQVIAKYYSDKVIESLRSAGIKFDLIIVPAGERFKTLKSIYRIYESLLDMKMDRAGALVALGGGVIGDMVGFAAATYMRGIDFYQAPTTLLSQVDASVGGKTGVDLPRGKNLIGAFYQPKAVFIDTLTLNTLPTRELRSGLAEVAKHGIIYDQEYYAYLVQNSADLLARREDVIINTVRRSVEIKRDVVESDERESGIRAILNYGHTVGHAVEVLSGYGKIRHGEATAIGMVTEALLAERSGIAESGVAEAVITILKKFKLPVRIPDSLSAEDIVEAARMDKKALAGQLRLALPTRIGHCGVYTVEPKDLINTVDAHKEWKIE